jgi:LacI family transcriptional regulator
MTVSRVINGDPRVRPETRALVDDAIRVLDYVPNVAARQLAGVEVFRIGLVFFNPSGKNYLSELLIGALEQIGMGGHQLVLKTCESRDEARKVIGNLVASGIDGLILPPPLCESREIFDDLSTSGTPVVAIGPGCPDPTRSVVLMDNHQAARRMTEHLLGLGHRHIGFIKGHPHHTASEERHRGFRDALADAGVEYDPRAVEQGYFDYHSGLMAAERLLDVRPRPTAVFAANDDMAAAVVAVAHRLRIEVPYELSVVGFDDTPIASTIWPTLTTVRQPVAEMGASAVRLLVDAMRGKLGGERPPPERQLLEYALVQRNSCAAPIIA